MAVERVLEQWEALILFFTEKHFQERLVMASDILETLRDPSMLLYFKFLKFVLTKFTAFNLMFQSAHSTVHILHTQSVLLYSELLKSYMDGPYVNSVHDISTIDPADERHFILLRNIYLGSYFHVLAQNDQYKEQNMLNDVRNRCRKFLIAACQEIRKRFPLGKNEVVEKCAIFDVEQVLSENTRVNTPTLADIVESFPRVYSGDIQLLDDEWRRLPAVQIPDSLRYNDNAEKFFKELYDFTAKPSGSSFRTLSEFALNILSLPTSNADAERIFSKLNLIKTKQRNKLSNTTTASLITLSEMVKAHGKTYDLSPDLLNSLQRIDSELTE